MNIFKLSYISLLNKYLKKTPAKKLKFIYTDTSFVPNKKGKEVIGYNKFYNRKNGTLASCFADKNIINHRCIWNTTKCRMLCWSTPLGVTRKGNKYDNKILLEQFEKWNTVNLTHIKTHNKYFLAQRVTSAYEVVDRSCI